MHTEFSTARREELFGILKGRFENNMSRHPGMNWDTVWRRLTSEGTEEKLKSLFQMEETGGEPDVLDYEQSTGEYIFYDCSAESPKGRRSVCYDRDALEARKEHKPKDSALGMAAAMGVEILTQEQYLYLQQRGAFDTKTSNWLRTPQEIRKLGGAIFGDRRYDHVFIYHNGADSYYAARGFRALLKI